MAPHAEHVLQVVPKKLPLVEVVLAAVLAGDHHPLDVLRAEDGVHGFKVLEVGRDVFAFLVRQLQGLVAFFFFHRS